MTKTQLSKADIKRACDILRMDDGVGPTNYIEQFSWLLFLKVFENIEEELRDLAEGKYEDIIEPEYKWSTWAKKDWKDKDELVYFINQKLFPYLRGLKGAPEKEKIAEIFREITNRIHSSNTLLDTIDILDQIKMEHFQDTHLLSQVYEEILQEMGSEGGWSGEFYTPRPIIRFMIKVINPKLGDVILDPFVGSGGFLVESFDYLQKTNPKMGVKEWERLQRKTFYGQEKKPLPYLIGMMNMILHRILVPNLVRTNTLMEDVHNMPESQKVDVVFTNPPFGGKENKSVQENYPIPMAATEGLALQYVMRRLKNGGKCGIVLPEGQILFGGSTFQAIREELLQKFNVKAIVSLPQGTFAQMGAGVKTNLVFFEKTGPTKEIWFGEVEGKFTKKKTIQDYMFNEVFENLSNNKLSKNVWVKNITEIASNNFDISPNNPNKVVIEKHFKPGEIISQSEDLIRDNKLLLDELKTECNELNHLLGSSSNIDWGSIRFGDYCNFNGGKQPPKSTFKYEETEGYVRLLQIRDFGEREEPVYVNKKNNLTYVDDNDILIGRYGASVGKILTGKKGAINVAIIKTIPKKELQKRYLYWYLKNPQFQKYITSIPGRMAQAGFDKGALVNLYIPMPIKNNKPDEATQQKIANKLDKIEKIIEKINKTLIGQIETNVNLSKSLLNEIFKQKQT